MARGEQTGDWRSGLATSAGTGAVPPSTGPVQDNPAAQTQNLLMTDNLKSTLAPAGSMPTPGVQQPPMPASNVPGVPPKANSGMKFGKGF